MSDFTTFIPRTVRKSELFTSSGTWIFPNKIITDSSGYATITITGIAGGGGGGRDTSTSSTTFSVAFGGCSGEFVQDLLQSVNGNLSITIGVGGAQTADGTGTADGNDGGDTIIGSMTLKGGIGGRAGSALHTENYNMLYDAEVSGAYNQCWPGKGTISEDDIVRDAQSPPGNRSGQSGYHRTFGLSTYDDSIPGAGGLVLDGSGTAAADGEENSNWVISTCSGGGFGYGAGGGGMGETETTPEGGRGGAGSPGAVLIEWWEYE